MTTREQKLRELESSWKADCYNRKTYTAHERAIFAVCYRGLRAILNEEVEVSDAMVLALKTCKALLNSIAEFDGVVDGELFNLADDRIEEALKEAGK